MAGGYRPKCSQITSPHNNWHRVVNSILKPGSLFFNNHCSHLKHGNLRIPARACASTYMFRNGLSVGRRSVRVSACIPIPAASSQIGRAATTKLSFKPEVPFVCLSCQVRSYAKPRKTRSPLEKDIKRLEQHVQLLEARYKDHVNQEAVKAVRVVSLEKLVNLEAETISRKRLLSKSQMKCRTRPMPL